MWDLVRGAAQLKQPTAGRSRPPLRGAARREPRAAGLPRAADHRPRPRRAPRPRLRAASARRGAAIWFGGRPTAAADARRAEVFDLRRRGARPPGGRRRRRRWRFRWRPTPHADHASRPSATGAARRTGCAIGPAASSGCSTSWPTSASSRSSLVSAAPESPGPHALAAPRLDGRGRLGDYLQSAEAAVVRDATRRRPRACRASSRFARRTTRSARSISPAATTIAPIGAQPLGELMSRGYEDAYHQFIEPVVGASGDDRVDGGRSE